MCDEEKMILPPVTRAAGEECKPTSKQTDIVVVRDGVDISQGQRIHLTKVEWAEFSPAR